MVSGIDLNFTFCSKIFHLVVGARRGTRQRTRVHERLSEVHDRVCKHFIRCTKKRVPRFLILEVLEFPNEIILKMNQ